MKACTMTSRQLIAVLTASSTLLTTSAFAITPGSGTWVKETATYGPPNLRNAYVYVPKNQQPATLGGKRALMLSLHGCGGSGELVSNKGFNWEGIAEEKGMVVVAPSVPEGINLTRLLPGCWDWNYGNHNRDTRDAFPIKQLLDTIKARPELDIDPNQIYITGFSSGAGLTMVLGCTFPDYFAGFGTNATPTLSSGPFDIFADPLRSAVQVRDTCKTISGNNSFYDVFYASQLYSVVYGENDGAVKPSHNIRNAEGMRLIYGTTAQATPFQVAGGGNGTMWSDAAGRERVSLISVPGMGHAWAAGSGGVGDQDYTHINYPSWVTNWFFANNLRVNNPPLPGPIGTCYNSTNADHISAGRAFNFLNQAFAHGSNQLLGAPDNATQSKVRNTVQGYYVIDVSCT